MIRTIAVLMCFAPMARAQEPASFPAATHGKGDLRYVGRTPVLTVRGTPAEMGDQFGILAVKNAPDIDGLHQRFLKDAGIEKTYPLVQVMANRLRPNFPAHHAAEIEAVGKAAGREADLLTFANTLADISSGMGCSTVVVEKGRSKTGGPLFGRNFDWQPTLGIHEHTLVVVYKGDGKRAFAAITVSPISGVISGMNDAGLCVTINEIHLKKSKDKAPFDWQGTPMLLAFRRVLEECGSVAEAEKLMRGIRRTTSCCLTLCDKDGGAVFEMTPSNLEVRSAVNGVCCCTNHFRTDKLGVDNKCWRYAKLEPLQLKDGPKLGVPDVFAALDDVHQGKATLQSMVFDPANRVLHLAHGEGPASRRDATKLELGAMFDAK